MTSRTGSSASALFNTKDNEGKTPAHHAVGCAADSARAQTGAARPFVGSYWFVWREAGGQAENGHADSLRVVHNGGGNLSVVDALGCSPCHYAAMNGHAACVAVIVDVRGDYRSKNAFGFTPLRLALRNRHAACASLIRNSLKREES